MTDAISTAMQILEASDPARPDNAYLARKSVRPTETMYEIDAAVLSEILGYPPKLRDCPFTGRLLVVPFYNLSDGQVQTLQVIDADTQKWNLTGGTMTGAAWCSVPSLEVFEDGKPLFVVGEGVATAATLLEAGAEVAFAAGGSGNLEAVAMTLRERFPVATIVIAGERGEKTGKARAAAHACHGTLALPAFPNDTGTDFNDLASKLSVGIVRETIGNALEQRRAYRSYELPEPEKKPASSTDALIELVDHWDVICGPDGTAYAQREDKRFVPVESKAFERRLVHAYRGLHGTIPRREHVSAACDLVAARAEIDGRPREVYLRVAEHDEKHFLDLSRHWCPFIEITSEGWNVVPDVPVSFVARSAQQPLPVPEPGGSVEQLREFVNVANDAEGDAAFVLIVAWLWIALRSIAPYPILVLQGAQGTAKSVLTRLLRRLIDPNVADIRSVPKDERDLMVTARHQRVQAFDNLSQISHAMSDNLCRLATGGALVLRRLHTNDDQVILDATAPIILNGIGDLLRRPDLLDRAIVVNLQPIAAECRRTEADIFADFDEKAPYILGALLDGFAHGLAREQEVKIELPRLADAFRWATACETAFWESGTVMRAFELNRYSATIDLVNGDPIGRGLRRLLASRGGIWRGQATELLAALAENDDTNNSELPTNARKLGQDLIRLEPALQLVGIDVERRRQGPNGDRVMTLKQRQINA